MEDSDQGGSANGADALPGQAQAGYANAVRRRKKRQARAYEVVYSHITDERIKEMLDALPADGRRGAAAWALVLRECDHGTSDLEILQMKQDFENASIDGSIGHNEETIIQFSRLLNSLNARIPSGSQRYTEDALCVKILANITTPDALALEAITELRATAGSRRFEKQVTVANVNVHVRDYQQLVTHFDSVWRGLFKQGVIRSRAAGKRHDDPGSRLRAGGNVS